MVVVVTIDGHCFTIPIHKPHPLNSPGDPANIRTQWWSQLWVSSLVCGSEEEGGGYTYTYGGVCIVD